MISNADDTQTLKGGKDGQVDRGGAGSRASGAQIVIQAVQLISISQFV